MLWGNLFRMKKIVQAIYVLYSSIGKKLMLIIANSDVDI